MLGSSFTNNTIAVNTTVQTESSFPTLFSLTHRMHNHANPSPGRGKGRGRGGQGSASPKKASTPSRQRPKTTFMVPISAHTPTGAPVVGTPLRGPKQVFDELLVIRPEAPLRSVIFDRTRPSGQLMQSIIVHGLRYTGNMAANVQVLTSVLRQLAEMNYAVTLEDANMATSQPIEELRRRGASAEADVGYIGSTNKAITLVFNLLNPRYCGEYAGFQPDLLAWSMDLDLMTIKSVSEGSTTIDVRSEITVIPTPLRRNTELLLSTINRTDRSDPHWRLVLIVTPLHKILDQFLPTIIHDLHACYHRHMTEEQYEHFAANLIVIPSRVHLVDPDERFKQCNGKCLTFYLRLDVNDEAQMDMSNCFLRAMLGNHRARSSWIELYGIGLLVARPSEFKAGLHMDVTDLSTRWAVDRTFLVYIDGLDDAFTTHDVYLLLCYSYRLDPACILNVMHSYDALSDVNATMMTRFTPRMAILCSDAETVLTILAAADTIIQDLIAIATSGTGGRVRIDPSSIMLSSPNTNARNRLQRLEQNTVLRILGHGVLNGRQLRQLAANATAVPALPVFPEPPAEALPTPDRYAGMFSPLAPTTPTTSRQGASTGSGSSLARDDHVSLVSRPPAYPSGPPASSSSTRSTGSHADRNRSPKRRYPSPSSSGHSSSSRDVGSTQSEEEEEEEETSQLRTMNLTGGTAPDATATALNAALTVIDRLVQNDPSGECYRRVYLWSRAMLGRYPDQAQAAANLNIDEQPFGLVENEPNEDSRMEMDDRGL